MIEVTLRKIRTAAHMENWAYIPGQKVSIERQNEVPEQLCVLIRLTIRDIFLKKNASPLLTQFTKEFGRLRQAMLQI